MDALEVVSTVNGVFYFYKVGKCVFAFVNGYKPTSNGNVPNLIPVGYRPTGSWRGNLASDGGDYVCSVFFRTTGAIEFTTNHLNIYYYGSISYVTD